MKLFILFIALSFSNLTLALDSNFEKTKQLAEQGDAEAQYQVGLTYYKLDIKVRRPHDELIYIQWFEKAAVQGHLEAQYYLGRAYAYAAYKNQNKSIYLNFINLANYWHLRAAERGHIEAQRRLGEAYYRGAVEIPKDHSQAVYWYQKAANQGDTDAQFWTGYMYYYGQGVIPNHILAYAYLNLATKNAVNEFVVGVKTMSKLKKEMSYEQITEAQNLSIDIFNQIEQNLASK